MKNKILLLMTLLLEGCWPASIYLQTEKAYSCTKDRYYTLCMGPLTEDQRAECWTEKQRECVSKTLEEID